MFHSRHSERDDDERRVRATLLPTSNRSNGYDRNSAGFDDLFDQRSRQAQDTKQAQDAILEDMNIVMTRLKGIGTGIGSELDTHSSLLDDLDEEIETSLGRFGVVEKKLTGLLEKSGWSHYKVILLLSLTATFLFFLILYT